jgi:hypothetical protein
VLVLLTAVHVGPLVAASADGARAIDPAAAAANKAGAMKPFVMLIL